MTDNESHDWRSHLDQYPHLQNVMEVLEEVSFKGLRESVDSGITTTIAVRGIRGLFQVPFSKKDVLVDENPDAFKSWMLKVFEGVDFSRGCCFWLNLQLPGFKGFPWICVDLAGGVEKLFPLWLTLKSLSVIIFAPASRCMTAVLSEETGWCAYRQPWNSP